MIICLAKNVGRALINGGKVILSSFGSMLPDFPGAAFFWKEYKPYGIVHFCIFDHFGDCLNIIDQVVVIGQPRLVANACKHPEPIRC